MKEVQINTIEGNRASLKKYISNCTKTKQTLWLGLLIAIKKRNNDIIDFITAILYLKDDFFHFLIFFIRFFNYFILSNLVYVFFGLKKIKKP